MHRGLCFLTLVNQDSAVARALSPCSGPVSGARGAQPLSHTWVAAMPGSPDLSLDRHHRQDLGRQAGWLGRTVPGQRGKGDVPDVRVLPWAPQWGHSAPEGGRLSPGSLQGHAHGLGGLQVGMGGREGCPFSGLLQTPRFPWSCCLLRSIVSVVASSGPIQGCLRLCRALRTPPLPLLARREAMQQTLSLSELQCPCLKNRGDRSLFSIRSSTELSRHFAEPRACGSHWDTGPHPRPGPSSGFSGGEEPKSTARG